MRLLATALLCSLTWAESTEWARFRGPNGTGVSEARNLPVEFGKAKNMIWRVETPKGVSSPVVSDGRVYITGFDGDNRMVLCLDAAKGELKWKASVPKERTEAANPMHGVATPTPAVAGGSVYVFFPEIGLLSFDKDGKERWKTPLGPFSSVQGHATSPIVIEDRVILSVDQTKDSYVAAFEAKTGKQVWKADRMSTNFGGYTTPLVYRPKGQPTQLIVSAGREITGYQARTGERLWWVTGFTNGPAASPTLIGDTLYSNEIIHGEEPSPFKMWAPMDKNKDEKIDRSEIKDPGIARLLMGIDERIGNNDGFLDESEWNKFEVADKGVGGMVALQLAGKGDISQQALRWKVTKGVPYLTSSLQYGDVVYSVRDGGILTSFKPGSGEIVKQARLEGALDKYYASPVAADGKIYFTSEQGKISVVKGGDGQWELLKVNDLEEPTYATPALVDGRIYVRTRQALYCFGSPTNKDAAN